MQSLRGISDSSCSRDKIRRFFLYIAIWFVICILAECFLFNFRFWESLGNDPVSPDVSLSYDDGSTIVDITGFDCHVNNLFIDITPAESYMQNYNIRMYANDATNLEGFMLPDTNIYNEIVESKYLRLQLNGNSTHFKCKIDNLIEEGNIRVTINAVRPFRFILIRLTGLFMLGAVILLLKSRLLGMPLDTGKPVQIMCIAIVSVFLAFIWSQIVTGSYVDEGGFVYLDGIHNVEHIYSYAARSFLNGHLHLDFDPPSYMKEMVNPYIESERNRLGGLTGEIALTDYAYFDGRYYCYYGIVPIILFYLPYVALTGKLVHNCYVIALLGALFIPISFALTSQLVKRFKGTIAFDSYLLLSLVFICCSGFMTFIKMSSIHTVPMATGFVFMVLGLYLWLKADEKPKLNRLCLVLGSISVALTLGCRPPHIVMVLAAFPIFWHRIKAGEFFRMEKKSIINTLMVIMPILLTDAIFLCYNGLCFANPLEFGSSLNLSRDLMDDGFMIERIPFGMYSYFFMPLHVNAAFPYVHVSNPGDVFPADYMGFIYNERLFGGVFSVVPFCLVLFLLPFMKFKKDAKEKGAKFFIFLLVILSVLIALLDLEKGGISNRYMTDFMILLVLASVIAVLSVKEPVMSVKAKTLFRIAAVISILMMFFLLLSDANGNSMQESMPYEYNWFKYLIFVLR